MNFASRENQETHLHFGKCRIQGGNLKKKYSEFLLEINKVSIYLSIIQG